MITTIFLSAEIFLVVILMEMVITILLVYLHIVAAI